MSARDGLLRPAGIHQNIGMYHGKCAAERHVSRREGSSAPMKVTVIGLLTCLLCASIAYAQEPGAPPLPSDSATTPAPAVDAPEPGGSQTPVADAPPSEPAPAPEGVGAPDPGAAAQPAGEGAPPTAEGAAPAADPNAAAFMDPALGG